MGEDTNRRHSAGGGSGEEEWTLFSTKHLNNARVYNHTFLILLLESTLDSYGHDL